MELSSCTHCECMEKRKRRPMDLLYEKLKVDANRFILSYTAYIKIAIAYHQSSVA